MRAWANGLLPSPRAAWVAAGIATVLALVSIWHAAAPTWRRLNDDHRSYAAYDDTARRQAASVHAGFAGTLWDRLASYVVRGDRVYYQVPRLPYGTLDLHDTFATLGRYYLAPAVEVTDPADATVFVSYDADPAALGRTFPLQRQLGDRVYFSRVRFP